MEFLALIGKHLKGSEGRMLPLETVGEGEEGKAFVQSRKMDVRLMVAAV